MSVWRAVSSAALALFLGGAAVAGPPQRVVSMNLCTDQLALLLAGPGQLVSVSHLARQAHMSPMAEAARALPANRGSAEDIVMLRPDLVLAGRFTTLATVQMLDRLGIPVVRFDLDRSLEDVAANLTRMGDVLGREEAAAAMVARYREDRAALEAHVARHLSPERAALWYARGFTGGAATLAGDILAAAGLHNIAGDLGLEHGGLLALEALILADPAHLVLGASGPGARSEAQALLHHPALRALPAHARGTPMADRDWVCGTPHVLSAVAELIAAREGAP